MNIKDFSLDSIQNIRTALRKRTTQTAIYKNQAEYGATWCQKELLAYVGFMSEEECLEFLNSIREAPFIPDLNVMWTDEVADYLMFGEMPNNMKEQTQNEGGADHFNKVTGIEPVPYKTSYIKSRVDERYWHLLPLGWCANYYAPSSVIRLAVYFHRESHIAQYITEKLFIKAADLEDCLKPTARLPPALPRKDRVRKVSRKNEVVLKDFPEGSHISIDLPETGKPVVPKVEENQKVRRNPVVTTQPMFAARDGRLRQNKQLSREINKTIETRHKGFGGDKTSQQLSEEIGISAYSIDRRIRMIRIRKAKADGSDKYAELHYNSGRIGKLPKETRESMLEAIKTRMNWFGGKDNAITLAKEFGVSDMSIYYNARKIRKSMGL